MLANKQDLPGAVSVEEMEGVLQLHNLSPERLWHVQVSSIYMYVVNLQSKHTYLPVHGNIYTLLTGSSTVA